jgi:hypothetical protein
MVVTLQLNLNLSPAGNVMGCDTKSDWDDPERASISGNIRG